MPLLWYELVVLRPYCIFELCGLYYKSASILREKQTAFKGQVCCQYYDKSKSTVSYFLFICSDFIQTYYRKTLNVVEEFPLHDLLCNDKPTKINIIFTLLSKSDTHYQTLSSTMITTCFKRKADYKKKKNKDAQKRKREKSSPQWWMDRHWSSSTGFAVMAPAACCCCCWWWWWCWRWWRWWFTVSLMQ